MPRAVGLFSPRPLDPSGGGAGAQQQPPPRQQPAERFQHIPGDTQTLFTRGGKKTHLQQSTEIAHILARPDAGDSGMQRSGQGGKTPGAPLFWKGERMEAAPGGHEGVDKMHHQRIGADVCEYNLDTSVAAVRASVARGDETAGGPPSNVERLKAQHDQRLLERQRVWREYGHDLSDQVNHNTARREDAWLAWLSQQQVAAAAHAAGEAGSVAGSEPLDGVLEDEVSEVDEDELLRMMRLGQYWDPQYRQDGVPMGGPPGTQRLRDPRWPASFDPNGLGPTSADPADYAVDLDNGWAVGFAALSDGISEVDSILGELWDEVGGEEPTVGDLLGGGGTAKARPRAAPVRRRQRGGDGGDAGGVLGMPPPQAAPTHDSGGGGAATSESEEPRSRWEVATANKATRDAMRQLDRGGTHRAIGEGAVAMGGMRDGPADRLMSSQHEMERFTNAILDGGDGNGGGVGASGKPAGSAGADGLGFLVPPESDDQQTAARRAEGAAYRIKAAGRMFGSPSVAQRTYHEGAHVATSMGIPGAGIMACFEQDKPVHERDLPPPRPDKMAHVTADVEAERDKPLPPRRHADRNEHAESPVGEASGASDRVDKVREAREGRRLEQALTSRESMIKAERKKGTAEARANRYVDSPITTGKPRVDRETGAIPWGSPMAQRTATFGNDPIGTPRTIDPMQTLEPLEPQGPSSYSTLGKPSAAQVAKATALMEQVPARMAGKVLKMPTEHNNVVLPSDI